MASYLKNYKISLADKKIIFDSMLRHQCFWVRPTYEFAGGFKGPFYGDVRKIISDPLILKTVGLILAKLFKRLKADFIAGCSMSGDAWAVAASLYSNLPVVLLRKNFHYHGPKSIICGFPFPKNKKAVILEDSVATGGELVKFYKNLKKEGYKNIKDIVTIIDLFPFSPAAKIKEKFFLENHLNLHYLFTIDDFWKYLLTRKVITKKYYQILCAWFADPVGWSSKRNNQIRFNKLIKNGEVYFRPPFKTIKGARL